tara:strand:- start:268 stop:432 length:165 start_codon:yes stop_codon:yes gene_type:complete
MKEKEIEIQGLFKDKEASNKIVAFIYFQTISAKKLKVIIYIIYKDKYNRPLSCS